MNKILLIIVLHTFSLLGYSQSLGGTKDKIINEIKGQYETGKTEDGTEFIYYSELLEYDGKKFTAYYAYYFDSDGKCIIIKKIYPIEVIDIHIKVLDKQFIKIQELKYKSYRGNSESPVIIEIFRNPVEQIFEVYMYQEK